MLFIMTSDFKTPVESPTKVVCAGQLRHAAREYRLIQPNTNVSHPSRQERKYIQGVQQNMPVEDPNEGNPKLCYNMTVHIHTIPTESRQTQASIKPGFTLRLAIPSHPLLPKDIGTQPPVKHGPEPQSPRPNPNHNTKVNANPNPITTAHVSP